jgi:hypothetical protein
MKEEFTIHRSHIADKFAQMMHSSMKKIDADDSSSESMLAISESTFVNCLSKLGTMLLERERSNYEQYTMYYENMLRQHHQLLYAREREIKAMENTLQIKNDEMEIEVKCQMTEAAYDLIMGKSPEAVGQIISEVLINTSFSSFKR